MQNKVGLINQNKKKIVISLHWSLLCVVEFYTKENVLKCSTAFFFWSFLTGPLSTSTLLSLATSPFSFSERERERERIAYTHTQLPESHPGPGEKGKRGREREKSFFSVSRPRETAAAPANAARRVQRKPFSPPYCPGYRKTNLWHETRFGSLFRHNFVY